MASPKAIDTARAVNSLLHLSSSEGVVEDYFTSPDEEREDSDWDGCDDFETKLDMQILIQSYTVSIKNG